MKIDSAGKTDIGKFREINEDYFYVDNTAGLFIVCDGLGGHAGGEVASHSAIEFTLEFLQENWSATESASRNPVGYFRLTQLVEKAIHQTCRRIRKMADNDPRLDGMATTLTLLLIVDGHAIVGHVGDSRLYIKRDGELFQLTTDHTLLHEITSSFQDVDPAQVRKFAHCLTRSVGSSESVAVETLIFEARQDDVLLLCTDGLSNYFSDPRSLNEMVSGDNATEIANSLVAFANDRGGKDNITAIVIRIEDAEDFRLNTRRIRLEWTGSDDTRPIDE